MGLFNKLKTMIGNEADTHTADSVLDPFSPEALDSPPYRFVDALHAARQGNVDKIRDYLNFNHHYVHCKNWDDCTLLHEAARAAQYQVVTVLIQAEADVNALYKDTTPLHLAIDAEVPEIAKNDSTQYLEFRKKRKATAQRLIEQGASLTACNDNGETPLHLAARLGHSELVALLLTQGIDVDLKIDSNKPNAGRTPLLLAARYNKDKRTISLLLDKGANPNLQDADPGFAALHYIASYHAPTLTIKEQELAALTQILIEHKADLNIVTLDKHAYTPLHLAVIRHHQGVLTTLVEAGANLHATDHKGVMPLGIAARRGDVELVKYLLDKGTDLYRSRALFHAASCTDSSAVMEHLFERGIDINMPDAHGYTPIFSAISAYSLKNVKLLMEKGIDTKQHSPRGMTVLEHAFACWGTVENVSGEEVSPERQQQADNARDIIQLLGGFDTPERTRIF
jgi:ankyrin repeat protein